MAGLAYGVADASARESGMEAIRDIPGHDSHAHSPQYEDSPYGRPTFPQETSHSSLAPLGAAAFPPGNGTPSFHSSVSALSRSNASLPDHYSDSIYYNRLSRNLNPNMEFDPNSIADDGDDGLDYSQPRNQRGSILNLGGGNSDRGALAGGAAAGAAAGGIMGTLGGIVGRNGSGTGSQYGPVGAPDTAYGGSNAIERQEKSAWLNKEESGNKRRCWTIGILFAVIILGAIGGGIAGGLLSKSNSNAKSSTSSSSSSGSGTASGDSSSNGDLSINSPEIQKLLGNANLKKVFPGMDYTPINTQYPDCLVNPPSQNNVTRDLAVLSQLTNTLRLYGTDCNQTEMVLHSIDRLDLKGTMKVWLGVWQDNNDTTNARQLDQMYKILNTYGTDDFLGVIVGNEVLFREDMTATQLIEVISGVRTNLTSLGYTGLSVASSDLGDNWTKYPALVSAVDYVMANIHPFFAGVPATEASGWTYSFYANNDLPLKTDPKKVIIAETGWPSTGGTDCGTDAVTVCPNGAVAAVDGMNTFMDDFVCGALKNGTDFFWFEAFDEPWKIVYDTTGKDWEDKWGLMDVNRNLKPGVVIPSCGGTTIGAAGS